MRVFDPWIGQKYWTDGLRGVRVLILGESHYGTEGTEKRSFTTDIVREWGQEKRLRFFTITQQLFQDIGSSLPSDAQRVEFWDSVAFYNFIQSFVGEEARISPTHAMWRAASDAFLATVSELRPQLIVVLGLELRSQLPQLPKDLPVCNVQHPSSYGFRVSEWQSVVSDALASLATKPGIDE